MSGVGVLIFFSLRLNFIWEHVITLEILYLQVPITVLTWCWSQCLHSYAYLSSTCLSLAPGTRCTFQRRLRRFVLKMLTDLSSTTHRQNIYCCCGFFFGYIFFTGKPLEFLAHVLDTKLCPHAHGNCIRSSLFWTHDS